MKSEEAASIPALKKWIVAVRPFAYTASVTSVLLGLAISVYLGYPVKWGLFALTAVGVVCFHTAANLLNDCFDFSRGLDREANPMSGAVVRGWLTGKQVRTAAIVFLAIGILCGVVLAYHAGPVVIGFGLVGTLIALGYTRDGFCFKYEGLGDLVIFMAFGLLPVFGAYWVQAGEFSWVPLLWSVPVALPTVGILHANNWRDIGTDPESGCRTVASQLGEKGSAVYYMFLTLGPFLLVTTYAVISFVAAELLPAPLTVFVSFLALPLGLKLAGIDRDDPLVLSMLDGRTAQLQLAFGVLLSVGFFVGPLLPEVP